MAYVDKLKIDSQTYDIKDSEARNILDEKLNIASAGNVTVSSTGNFSIKAGKNVQIAANPTYNQVELGAGAGSGTPSPVVSIAGRLKFNYDTLQEYNDNFGYIPVDTGRKSDLKLAVIKDDADFSQVKPSPHSIEEFQTLKKDGTDDITATLNKYTQQFPLFIPVGTYKISAPIQLKHSLFGAGSSRDPVRGTSDTVLLSGINQQAFGNTGVLTVSGTGITGNIVIANLDIICGSFEAGICFTTDSYTDNSIYNVSIAKVKTYGVYLQPANSTLNRYCYMDNVSVWGYSDNTPKERWDGSTAFYWGDKSPDCECNNLLSMVCQTGFDCRTNVYGCNWTSYNGIPATGSGGGDANTWWESTCGLKVTNNDVHITNLYLDTIRRGIIFDGPGKAAAYINNILYTCNDATATTATGYACLALIGTSPNPQLVINGGAFNRTAKVDTMIQTIGTYPVKNMACTIDGMYIYADRNVLFPSSGQQICAYNEHKLIDADITTQKTYTIAGQSVTGDPEQYKAFAYIPYGNANALSQGTITIRDRNYADITVFLSVAPTSASAFQIAAFHNRTFANKVYNATTGSVTPACSVEYDNRLYYTVDADHKVLILYYKRPASYAYTVTVDGFNAEASPVILDRVRNTDGTPIDYPRWDNANGMTPIKIFTVRLS